jgi:hypothetical protein
MSKKQEYILKVVGAFVAYCLLIYIIRRNMGISSTFEDVRVQSFANDSLESLIKERKKELIEEAEEAANRQQSNGFENIVRSI